jgi:hypothetical protein
VSEFKVGDTVRRIKAAKNGTYGVRHDPWVIQDLFYDDFLVQEFALDPDGSKHSLYNLEHVEGQPYPTVAEMLGDPVSHPAHYTQDPSGVECITITRHRNFNVGNAIKYLWRNGLKDSDNPNKQIEDLRKAIFYINDEIERLTNGS